MLHLTSLEAAQPATEGQVPLQVRRALTLEMQPETTEVDRRQVLNPLAHPATASDVTWWQAGFVKRAGGWHSAETTPEPESNSATLNEYRSKRTAASATVARQLELANWCATAKLPDQERAHLTQAVLLAPPTYDTTAIYKRLGYRLIGSRWISPTELREWAATSRRAQYHYREWRPVVDRISRNWMANVKQRATAQRELNGIHEASAVPALVSACGGDKSLAVAICEQLAKVPAFEASQALAVMAVRTDSDQIRQAAIGSLKKKRLDDFVPALLAEMRSPFSPDKTKNNDGQPKLLIREEADRYVAVELALVPVSPAVSINYSIRRNTINVVDHRNIAELRDQAFRIQDAWEELQREVADENDRVQELNDRTAAVLAEVSGQEPSSDPRYWWAWWNLHTGTEPVPKKSLVVRRGVPVRDGIKVTRASCLVAGTPIATRHGLVAIDQICVGDEVLSKNIETGELDYRPVLQTTTRQPVSVTKFSVAGTTIVSSEGHHYWISGEGWTKTRDLRLGQPIHTVSGMSRIESVSPESEPAPVYNLVVADFHTYFIGPGMILSHDVTQPAPTNVKVPGLNVD